MSVLTYEQGRLTQKYLDELACQYRDSQNLCNLLTAFLGQLEIVECNLVELCQCMDLETATGQCLTAIGEMVGWPRTHCGAQCTSGFGFQCGPADCNRETLLGWCSGTWLCETEQSSTQDYTFIDDELYRRFIKAQIINRRSVGTVTDVQDVIQILFDDDACITRIQNQTLEITIPRLLTDEERAIVSLYSRVIPKAIGTSVLIRETNGTPFGWSCGDGVCEPVGWCEGAFALEVTSIC